MSYGIIYKATSPTSKVYIGQTTQSLATRKSNHKAKAIYYKDRRTPFWIALIEHGFSAFSWDEIDRADNQAELDEKEKQWIAYYNSSDPQFGYNGTGDGIIGGFHGKCHSNESKKKISKSLKGKTAGEKHPFFGKHLPEETRRKISEAGKGNKHLLGHHHSEETRRKMSEAHKNPSAETRKKLSEAGKGKQSHAKLTEAQVMEIKTALANREKVTSIAKKFNVSIGNISMIKHNKIWSFIKIGA